MSLIDQIGEIAAELNLTRDTYGVDGISIRLSARNKCRIAVHVNGKEYIGYGDTPKEAATELDSVINEKFNQIAGYVAAQTKELDGLRALVGSPLDDLARCADG